MKNLSVFLLAGLLFAAERVAAERTSDSDDNPIASLVGAVMEQADTFTLSESDYKTIQRKGNTFYVPAILRRKVLFNLPALADQAEVSRVRINEKDYRFRVARVGARSIFSYGGIKAGDIVQSVNGRPIRSEQDAMDLLSRLSNSEKVTIALERGKERSSLQLTYIIAD